MMQTLLFVTLVTVFLLQLDVAWGRSVSETAKRTSKSELVRSFELDVRENEEQKKRSGDVDGDGFDDDCEEDCYGLGSLFGDSKREYQENRKREQMMKKQKRNVEDFGIFSTNAFKRSGKSLESGELKKKNVRK